MYRLYFISLAFVFFSLQSFAFKLESPSFHIKGKQSNYFLVLNNTQGKDSIKVLLGENEYYAIRDETGKFTFSNLFEQDGSYELIIPSLGVKKMLEVKRIPLYFSLLPPLVTILIALLFKEVIVALFLGLFSGTLILYFYVSTTFLGFLKSLFSVIDIYIINVISSTDHISIILFTLIIGGMVNLISKNGGLRGIVQLIRGYAKTRRTSLLAVWFMGIIIFFDDYANVMIVGKTMGKLTKSYSVSKEKLSYIVDSTAAPIAAIGLITTWIGSVLIYIGDSLVAYPEIKQSTYSIFLNSLEFSFYPFITIFFVLMIILLKRDFGPMYKAEMAAIKTINSNKEKRLESTQNSSKKATFFKGILPILTILIGTALGLFYTGWDNEIWMANDITFFRKLSITIGASNSYKALIWASFSALMVSLLPTLFRKSLSIKKSIGFVVDGFKEMLPSIIILILAWSMADITKDLHTADFIAQIINGFSYPEFLPAIVFIISGFVAFSTGSSWGAMAILYAILIPAVMQVCKDANLPHEVIMNILHASIASILSGAVFGDHCSPISDTTILSSTATSCNHLSHVKTQLPYALLVAGIAILFGIIPASYGVPFWITFPISILIAYLAIRIFGKKVELNTEE